MLHIHTYSHLHSTPGTELKSQVPLAVAAADVAGADAGASSLGDDSARSARAISVTPDVF